MKEPTVFLKSIEPTDISFIFEGLSHPEVVKYYGVHFYTLEETQEQMDWYRDLEEQKTGKWWIVCDLNSKVQVGAGGFNNWDKHHAKAELGFWLLPQFWGKGFMKASLPLIMSFGFNNMSLVRIEGFVEHENNKCKQALQKAKFRHEATLKQNEIKDGRFIDIDVYAFLKRDWS